MAWNDRHQCSGRGEGQGRLEQVATSRIPLLLRLLRAETGTWNTEWCKEKKHGDGKGECTLCGKQCFGFVSPSDIPRVAVLLSTSSGPVRFTLAISFLTSKSKIPIHNMFSSSVPY